MLALQDACTGCSACAQTCPTGAITMVLNKEGFLEPQIQKNECIQCRKCEQVCPVAQNIIRHEDFAVKGYAASLKDAQEIYNSTSGGLFYALAKEVLRAGGTVFGAALTQELQVEHRAAGSEEELVGLRKSKYVQSDLKDTYAQVRRLLTDKISVLFSGTPCQCAGLYAYLGHGDANLLMIEVFCGQVTGRLSWMRYMEYLQKRNNTKLHWFGFREKPSNRATDNNLGLISGGWKDPYTKVYYDGSDSETFQWRVDKWTVAYINHLMQRTSCGQCKFKQQSGFNYADIAIGDFWGAENNAPEVFNPNGTSAALVYSEKGEVWLKKARKWVKLSEVDIGAIRRGNPDVWSPVQPNPNRNRFLDLLREENIDFDQALVDCLGAGRTGKGKSIRFGVWGGFNVRRAVFDTCNLCGGTVEFHISNINLISQASEPLALPTRFRLPANPLRADMLKLDFDKSAFTEVTEGRMKNVDFLVIDFMEERFPALAFERSYITDSDALQDSSLEISAMPFPQEDVLSELWKESCLKFIDQLKKFYSEEQIIVVRSLLSARYEAEPGRLQDFDNSGMQCSIFTMNRILEQKYDYFLQHCRTKKVIMLDTARLYCEYGHKHGVVPSHSNRECTADIIKQICAIAGGR